MVIKINSKGIKVTNGMKAAVESKMKVLDKFIDDLEQIKISVSSIKKEIDVSVFFVYEGKIIKAERSDDDFYFIIDEIVDILKEKLEKLHTKKIKKQKDQENALKKLEYDSEKAAEDAMVQELIIKKKEINISDIYMTPEEAIDKMEEMGHESFIFSNSITDKTSMIYSRNDGGYGLIEITN